MPSLNLYAIGAALIVILGLTTWGFWEKATIDDYKTQIATMNGEMAQAKASHDIAIANLNTTLETTHAAHSQEITAVGSELQRTAAELDRLRANPRPSCGNRVRAAAVPQRSAPVGQPAPGGFQELVAIATRCFAAASYAEDAHAWAVSPQVSK